MILDREGRSFQNLPPMLCSRTDAEDLSLILTHLARFILMKELRNPRPYSNVDDNTTSIAFRELFDVYITNQPGIRHEPEQVLEVPAFVEPDRKTFAFQLHFINKSEVDLFVHVYALSPLWEVSQVQFAPRDVVPPKARAHHPAHRPRISKKFRTKIPQRMRDGYLHAEDIMKVFVTSRPTMLDILEQPSIESLLKDRTKFCYRDIELLELYDLFPSEDWDAFNFPVRTIPRQKL